MKFVHVCSVFLTLLALALSSQSYAKNKCSQIFAKPSKFGLVATLFKSTRDEQIRDIQNYSRQQLISSGVRVQKPKGFFAKTQVNVLLLNETNFTTLTYASSLPQPLIWVTPKMALDGRILSVKNRAFAGRFFYQNLVRPSLELMGARALNTKQKTKISKVDRRTKQIEIRSKVFSLYHAQYKTPHSTKKDYVEYRDYRGILTQGERVLNESYELMVNFPSIFAKLISHPHFNVYMLETVFTLPRPYLKLIEEHLLYGNDFVFMNSKQQPVTIGTMKSFLKVLNLLTYAPVVYYQGRFDAETQVLEIKEDSASL